MILGLILLLIYVATTAIMLYKTHNEFGEFDGIMVWMCLLWPVTVIIFIVLVISIKINEI